MGWFDQDSDESRTHDSLVNNTHGASLTHEALGGAAAFYAARKYEEHVAENGPPPNHALAKELLAGFAGAFIDREVETKGLDFIDTQKAKHHAKKRAEEAYEQNTEGYN